MDQPHGPERENEPPALPIKQRRSHYSGGGSVSSNVDLELDRNVSSLLGYHAHEGQNSTDVFLTAIDCHAPQCPIHQRYDPSYCHQERFFSDSVTPPPVPKKKMTRTMSLPGVPFCPLATSPLQPLSQLNFDTPDEQLSYFFSSFFNQVDLSRGIQHRHLQFLRSMAQHLEARVLLMTVSGVGSGPFQPKDFLLFENNPPIQIAGSHYYSLRTPTFPDRILAAKVNSDVPPMSRPHSVPPHVNIQQVIVSFPACPALHKDPESERTIPSDASQSEKRVTESSHGLSIEADRSLTETEDIGRPSVVSLLHKGHTVTVERDLPQATLEDFVQEGRLLQTSEPLVYERQLSILLLQLASGLQHLCSNEATCVHLRAHNVLLVWPVRERWAETKADKAEESGRREEKEFWENEREERKKEVQELWRKWGTPRVVLTFHPCHSGPCQPTPSIKGQLSALLEYCLHRSDSASSQNTQCSDNASQRSPYLPGLRKLASWLQDGGSGLKMAEILGLLQAVIWGPREALFRINPNRLSTLQNWLSIKQALLLLKLAERGLIQDRLGFDWEQYLCLQYISFTDSETVMKTMAKLGLHNTED